MVELVFQKDNIGLGKRKQAVARVFLVPGEGNLIINKVSGEKYLQYNNSYLNLVWSPLEKLSLDEQKPKKSCLSNNQNYFLEALLRWNKLDTGNNR